MEDEFDNTNLTNALKQNFKNNTIIKFTKDNTFKDEILKIANNYEHIVIYSYDAYYDNIQIDVINELLKLDKEVHVISIKGPADEPYFKGLTNYSCLYEYTPNSIKTIIKQLKNEILLKGMLPIK